MTASEVLGASAAKMPPVWNQRTPSSPNSFSQFTSPGLICEAAEWPRSEQPSAARMPKPFSVKFRPTRVLRPRPSNSRQMIFEVSTPPCIMRSSTSQPRSLTGRAVTARGALAPALAHGARDVVFAAAFPHLEAARIAHAAEARIEAQHHFAERGAVPARLRGGLDLQNVVGHVTVCFHFCREWS